MPRKLARGCAQTGCPELTSDPSCYCPEHKKLHQSEREAHRGSSTERGYGYRWQKARDWYLKHNPFCVECTRTGMMKEATVVDHIKDHKGDLKLFWDENNWQSLCKHHHDVKTARREA